MLKGARLSGEQLALISDGRLTVEQAVAENKSFHPRLIGQHFRELDRSIDILGPLRKPIRKKVSLLEHLEKLVEQRHSLIHSAKLDITLDTKKLQAIVVRITTAMDEVYAGINRHYGWTDAIAQIRVDA